MPLDRRQLFKKMGKLKKLLVNEKSVTKLVEILSQRSELEIKLKNSYESSQWADKLSAIENIKNNPKHFFKFARSKQKVQAKVGPFLDPKTGNVNPDLGFTVESLKAQYESVFSEPKTDRIVSNPEIFFKDSSSDTALEDIEFTIKDIQVACAQLSSNSAAGSTVFLHHS